MTTLVEYFGGAYLINLPERKDRLNRVKKELARIGWEIGDNGVQTFPAFKFSARSGFPNAGARGCFLSHLECMRRAHAEKRRGVLILEDDISFSSSLNLLTPSIISQLDIIKWDVVFFGHHGTGGIPDARRNTMPDELEFISWSADVQGCHFYAISGHILSSLIGDLERHINGIEGDQEYGPMPVDGAINIFRRNNPDVRTIIVQPKLGWQVSSRSDITPRYFDRIPWLEPFIRALRKVKAAIIQRNS
jgi:GR25 family glycosyltransferase involved in LPS biosynthesis